MPNLQGPPRRFTTAFFIKVTLVDWLTVVLMVIALMGWLAWRANG